MGYAKFDKNFNYTNESELMYKRVYRYCTLMQDTFGKNGLIVALYMIASLYSKEKLLNSFPVLIISGDKNTGKTELSIDSLYPFYVSHLNIFCEGYNGDDIIYKMLKTNYTPVILDALSNKNINGKLLKKIMDDSKRKRLIIMNSQEKMQSYSRCFNSIWINIEEKENFKEGIKKFEEFKNLDFTEREINLSSFNQVLNFTNDEVNKKFKIYKRYINPFIYYSWELILNIVYSLGNYIGIPGRYEDIESLFIDRMFKQNNEINK